MRTFRTILILHQAAIGDAVLATPVLVSLKRSYPEASIVYVSHRSLFPLIALTGVVDRFVEWNRSDSVFRQSEQLRQHNPDLVIDLIDSLRSRLVCLLIGVRSLRYRKCKSASQQVHAVDNFLQTLDPLALSSRALFPTLTPDGKDIASISERFGDLGDCVAIVPGVGKNRPSRAWPAEHWVSVGRRLQAEERLHIGIVGGAEDVGDCSWIAGQLDPQFTTDLAGKLSLTETAAFLSLCRFVISGDTGPAHIAVAVGRKVAGLMGPTYPERSGPYGMGAFGLDACNACQCKQLKRCRLNDGSGPGKCMKSITAEMVWEKLAPLRASLRGSGSG